MNGERSTPVAMRSAIRSRLGRSPSERLERAEPARDEQVHDMIASGTRAEAAASGRSPEPKLQQIDVADELASS